MSVICYKVTCNRQAGQGLTMLGPCCQSQLLQCGEALFHMYWSLHPFGIKGGDQSEIDRDPGQIKVSVEVSLMLEDCQELFVDL
jgi:hypothetical protein